VRMGVRLRLRLRRRWRRRRGHEDSQCGGARLLRIVLQLRRIMRLVHRRRRGSAVRGRRHGHGHVRGPMRARNSRGRALARGGGRGRTRLHRRSRHRAGPLALRNSPGIGITLETAAQLVQVETLFSLSAFVVRVVFLLPVVMLLLSPLLLAIRTSRRARGSAARIAAQGSGGGAGPGLGMLWARWTCVGRGRTERSHGRSCRCMAIPVRNWRGRERRARSHGRPLWRG